MGRGAIWLPCFVFGIWGTPLGLPTGKYGEEGRPAVYNWAVRGIGPGADIKLWG